MGGSDLTVVAGLQYSSHGSDPSTAISLDSAENPEIDATGPKGEAYTSEKDDFFTSETNANSPPSAPKPAAGKPKGKKHTAKDNAAKDKDKTGDGEKDVKE